jgi:hypothetical protein
VTSPPTLPADLAQGFAATALANVQAAYPFHLVHFARSAADLHPPDALHPAFFGSYDWHSCVHMHWTLVRLWTLAPELAARPQIEAQLDARLTPDRIAGELHYFTARASFERPYGWGWLLALHAALVRSARTTPRAAAWRDAVAPLADLLATRCIEFLPRSAYPVRAGTHGNTAFALVLMLDWAVLTQHPALRSAIVERAQHWYGRDRRYPAHFEPSGDDFLSGGLCEALLMQRVLDACDWVDWWEAFAPEAARLATWLTPVQVSDATDPKIVHLHGLNLSRAWCWRTLAPHLPAALQPAAHSAVDAHLAASLDAATAGHYVGTHWLASFALLALGLGGFDAR